nr:4718_t:CDS:2 [Entrophospora candida]
MELIFNLDFYEVSSLLNKTTTSEFNFLYEKISIPDIDEVLRQSEDEGIQVSYDVSRPDYDLDGEGYEIPVNWERKYFGIHDLIPKIRDALH